MGLLATGMTKEQEALLRRVETKMDTLIGLLKNAPVEINGIVLDDDPTDFQKPTVEEVRAFSDFLGGRVDPEAFMAYYEANGWTDHKGRPLKDWRAALSGQNGKLRALEAEAKRRPNSVEDVAKYFESKGHPELSERFFDWYEARGWKVKGGKKISNWKVVADSWIAKRDKEDQE